MGVEKIHACPNHCILFCGETFKSLDKCPRCGASRYKNNDLYGEDEPSTRKKRNKKGTKKVVQESQPLARGHSIRQRCKAEKNSYLGNVVPASDRPLETYLPKP